MQALRIVTVALTVLGVGAESVVAQVTATTGALDGTAADETGAVLPGVTVTATSSNLQGQQVVVTDAEGTYRIPALPPSDDYRVIFELPGFTTLIREGILLGIGFTATIDAALRVATLEETVTVRGESPVVDVAATRTSTNFDAAKLASLPGARDFWAILANAPTVTMSRIDVGASRAGNQTGYASYDTKMTQHRPMVEGMVMTEGRGGACFYYDFGSMDEVSVQTGTHTAEMGWPGVQTQFIAKSGGNAYHGTARADYQCGDWQATNIDQAQLDLGVVGGEAVDAEDTNKMHRYWDFHADVGGYVLKDRLWVYGSAREQDIRVFRTNFPVKPFRTHLNALSGKATYAINQNNKAIFYTMSWTEEPAESDELASAGQYPGESPEHGRDPGTAQLGVGDQGRVELSVERPGVPRGPGWEGRERDTVVQPRAGPMALRRPGDPRGPRWVRQLPAGPPPDAATDLADLLPGRLGRDPQCQGGGRGLPGDPT